MGSRPVDAISLFQRPFFERQLCFFNISTWAEIKQKRRSLTKCFQSDIQICPPSMELPRACPICCLIGSVLTVVVVNGVFTKMAMNKTAAGAVALAAGLMLALSAGSAAAQCGRASWYALHSSTASGERMNPAAMTAAHRSLPFGTKVKVTNQNNGRSVVVRINDRGPFDQGPGHRPVARLPPSSSASSLGPHQRSAWPRADP